MARENALLLATIKPMVFLIQTHNTVLQALSNTADAASSSLGGVIDAMADQNIPADTGAAIIEKWMDDLDNTFQDLESRGLGVRDRCLRSMRSLIQGLLADTLALLEDEANGKISKAVAGARLKHNRSLIVAASDRALRCVYLPEPQHTVAQAGGGGDPPVR